MSVQFIDVVLFSSYLILLFLALFWLLVFLSPKGEMQKKKVSVYPVFTVIVPARNEQVSIVATLQSLMELDYPSELLEIIVSINASTDLTKSLVEQFVSEHPKRSIKVVVSDQPGKGAAMNRALKISRGKFFACLDADSFIHSNALKEMLPYFAADPEVAAVCPLMKVRKPKNLLQKVQWCEYIINMFYKFLNSKVDAIHVTPGPFSVYKTEVIKEIGWFDEKTITEDLEIAIRLQKHHYRIVQTFDAIVETNAPLTWKALFRQRIRWYKGSVDNSLKYRQLMFNRQYGDFGFVRMPTIILGGIMAVILLLALLRELVLNLIKWSISSKAINFDYFTVLRNASLQINFLTLPIFKIIVAATLLSISFWVMIYAYKLSKEDIRNHGRTWISLITYLSIYSFFITLVWIYIGYMFLARKKNFWS